MIYRLTKHRGYTALYVVVQFLNYSLEKRSRYCDPGSACEALVFGLPDPDLEERRN
jgi:hypothetical protein